MNEITDFTLRAYGKRLGYDGLSNDETVAVYYALDDKFYVEQWGAVIVLMLDEAIARAKDRLTTMKKAGVYCDEDAIRMRNVQRLIHNLAVIKDSQKWNVYK